jgi:hypothetical protein
LHIGSAPAVHAVHDIDSLTAEELEDQSLPGARLTDRNPREQKEKKTSTLDIRII